MATKCIVNVKAAQVAFPAGSQYFSFVRVSLIRPPRDAIVKGEIHSTPKTGKVNQATLDGPTIRLGDHFRIERDAFMKVRIEIVGKTHMIGKDTVIASLQLDVDGLAATESPQAVALKDKSGQDVTFQYAAWLTEEEDDGAAGEGMRRQPSRRASLVIDAQDEFFRENPEDRDKEPNELRLEIIEGRNLIAMDNTGYMDSMSGKKPSSDPYLKVKIVGKKDPPQLSECVRQTLNPPWRSKFKIVTDAIDDSISVEVWDKDFSNGDDFMGCITPIDLDTLRSKEMVEARWIDLRDRTGGSSNVERGSIKVRYRWIYTVEAAAALEAANRRSSKLLANLLGHEEEDEEEGLDAEEESKTEAELELERQAAKKLEQEREQQLAGMKIKSGDYQLRVHIIEARELAARDLEGTSDPVIFIEAFGQKVRTRCIKKVRSAVFDEEFIINVRNLDKDDFEDAVIKVNAMDQDMLNANDLIGGYALDAPYVYYQPHHELYRTWVALTAAGGPSEESSVKGYLKLSLTILGPGDNPFVHPSGEEDEEEGDGIPANVLMPPTIRQKREWLVVCIYGVQDLVVLDHSFANLGTSGIDAYFKVEVGTHKPVKTKSVKIRGNDRLAMKAAIRKEIWIPIFLPTMTNKIKVGIWDKDLDGDDLVGMTSASLQDLIKMLKAAKVDNGDDHSVVSLPYRWYNLYGAPEKKEALRDLTKPDFHKIYNEREGLGSTYRGRALLSFKLSSRVPPKKKYEGMETFFMRKFKGPQRPPIPPSESYSMFADVYIGDALPESGPIKHAWSVTMTCGLNERSTEEKKSKGDRRGRVDWFERIKVEGMPLPRHDDFLDDVPDIIFYLRHGRKRVCFKRFTAKELMELGWRSDPVWVDFQEDKAANKLPAQMFPGSVLMKFAFGPAGQFATDIDAQNHWQITPEQLYGESIRPAKHTVRLNVYMARELPATDSNGLSDPYLTASLDGQKPESKNVRGRSIDPHMHKFKTVDPTYFSSLDFCVVLPSTEVFPEALRYAPRLQVKVHDKDLLGDAYVGNFFIDLYQDGLVHPKVSEEQFESLRELQPAEAAGDDDGGPRPPAQGGQKPQEPKPPSGLQRMMSRMSSGSSAEESVELFFDQQHAPLPRWYELFFEVPGDQPTGRFLCSVEIFRTDIHRFRPPVRNLRPEMKQASLEIVVLGLRDLAAVNMIPVSLPTVEFEVETADGMVRFSTNTSKKPTPANPNFLERHVQTLNLPVSAIFAPVLKVKAQDVQLGGFRKPTVGVTSVSLDTMLPWTDEYVHPHEQDFSDAAAAPDAAADARPIVFGDGATERESMAGRETLPGAEEAKAEVLADAAAAAPGGGASPARALPDAALEAPTAADAPSSVVAEATAGGGGAELEAYPVDVVATPAPQDIEAAVRRVRGSADEGTGVFPALLSMPEEPGSTKARTVKEPMVEDRGAEDEDDDGEEEQLTPEYMKGRTVLSGESTELEDSFSYQAFQTFPLYRGEGKKRRVVGHLKALIRVVEYADEAKLIDIEALLRPSDHVVRLYVLKAQHLAQLDSGFGGAPGSSDPYLRVQLGKQVINGRKEHLVDVTDAPFFKMYEFPCAIPGCGRLKIDCFDYDVVGGDDIIGSTSIDIEDRWFNKEWKALGMENQQSPDEGGDSVSKNRKIRFATKPLETRRLIAPMSGRSQGELQCWVDIMTASDAVAFPPDHIEQPPAEDFEVRVVIWKAKDVVPMDTFGGQNMTDMYIKGWMEGDKKPQVTDTHWRAKKGKASWNWRFKFPVQLGPNTFNFKYPYLKLQAWDKDVAKWDDIIGETTVPLKKYFRKALAKKRQVIVYDDRLLKKKTRGTRRASAGASAPAPTPGGEKSAGGLFGCFGGRGRGGGGEGETEDDAELPLLDHEADREAEAEDEAEFISMVKDMTGLFDDDPRNSGWLDFEDGNKKLMGRLCISIEVLPVAMTHGQPAGMGRSEPNAHPFLPPPTGRLKFTWNPFSLGAQLCGPKLCFYFSCCLFCAVGIVLLIFCQPLLNLMIALFVR